MCSVIKYFSKNHKLIEYMHNCISINSIYLTFKTTVNKTQLILKYFISLSTKKYYYLLKISYTILDYW